MNPTSTCRSCGAGIVWGRTQADRAIPLDPDPHPEGNVVTEGREGGRLTVTVFATSADVPGRFPLRYRSHFVTCPDAGEWRRR